MNIDKRISTALPKQHDIVLEVPAKEHKFLKVAPNLFTPENLNLFDTLELYTSLIKSSKALEQGERLHNLSWRIVNKALLKDHNVNKSKKRDGVRNLYHCLLYTSRCV